MHNNQISVRRTYTRSMRNYTGHRAWRILWRRFKYRALLAINMAAFLAGCFAVVMGLLCMLICWS